MLFLLCSVYWQNVTKWIFILKLFGVNKDYQMDLKTKKPLINELVNRSKIINCQLMNEYINCIPKND